MAFSVRAALEQFALPHPSGEGQLTISVAVPTSPMPDTGVPILYVVDGDLLFGMAAEIARAMSSVAAFPAHYVVGIGYDAAYSDVLKLRTADLAPPIGAEALESLGGLAAAIGGARSGGADAFLTFLTDRLRPEVTARYPQTADGPHILFGHSLGGLFAARALLTRPDSFSAFIASSPSLWWDGFSILSQLPPFRERLAALPRQPRVFVDVGAREQELPTSVPDGIEVTLEEAQAQIRAARMVDAACEFATALREAGVAELRHVAFAEDDHVSAAPAAILHGMRFALGRER
ncbi:alpha/beta hydrolase [Sphingopyxis sp. GW247-27LB]|uniref:alpha/beta hydrolase n=1 Tax=Sphingopyxis sp. GW247-27LB TaxID=2012632 RepID=UPI001595F4C8|nr:alpha/beta hydrolase-fold protein [Sphingopyxis sp. GW247-27LB]